MFNERTVKHFYLQNLSARSSCKIKSQVNLLKVGVDLNDIRKPLGLLRHALRGINTAVITYFDKWNINLSTYIFLDPSYRENQAKDGFGLLVMGFSARGKKVGFCSSRHKGGL